MFGKALEKEMVLNARLSTIHPYYSADIVTKPIRALMMSQKYNEFATWQNLDLNFRAKFNNFISFGASILLNQGFDLIQEVVFTVSGNRSKNVCDNLNCAVDIMTTVCRNASRVDLDTFRHLQVVDATAMSAVVSHNSNSFKVVDKHTE